MATHASPQPVSKYEVSDGIHDPGFTTAGAFDPRHQRHGRVIPTVSYCDQPYIIKTDDGAWLVSVTTGAAREGQPGQHVITMRSEDRGQTWSNPVRLEPEGAPENSYSVLLKAESGRIYVFYDYNADNMRWLHGDDPPYKDGKCPRMDSMGQYVFRYSDDHGRSWSRDRHVVDIREFQIDRDNPYQGKVRIFWNVGKPIVHDGVMYLPHHKIGWLGYNFIQRSEGVIVRSENIMTESDPEKIVFETLPDGDVGLRTPPGGGPIAEEQSLTVLSDGSLYCVYRCTDGHPVFAISRDRGHTWSEPQYMRYANGELVKHPRAANFVWRCSNGKFIYWFHNHGGRDYNDRNPVWMCGGVEVDGPDGRTIAWSQPEIMIYTEDTYIRMSYPDMIEEDDGKVYISETEKNTARVHEIPREFLERVWQQFENPTLATEGLLLDIPEAGDAMPGAIECPELPEFTTRNLDTMNYSTFDRCAGVTFEFIVEPESVEAGQVIAENRDESGRGFAIRIAKGGRVEITIDDGRTCNSWDSGDARLKPGEPNHVGIVIDGGPKIISMLHNGRFCDGGTERQFGWGRFNPHFRSLKGAASLRLGQGLGGRLDKFRIYGRALMSSELLGNFKAGS